MSTPSGVAGRSRTLTHVSGPVERFHSVRKILSCDDANVHTCSTDSGLFGGDDDEIYSNWSSQCLSDIQDLSRSDEDISTDDSWVC